MYTLCHRGGQNRGPTGTPTQGPSLTVRAPCQLCYLADWLTFDISPSLIRLVPESARNKGSTNETCTFDARGPSREPTLSQQLSQRMKNRGPTGTRTQVLSLTVRALCQLSIQATWSTFDICKAMYHIVAFSLSKRFDQNDIIYVLLRGFQAKRSRETYCGVTT